MASSLPVGRAGLTGLLLLACAGSLPEQAPPPEAVLSSVRYRLRWDTTGAERLPDGGWSIRSDAGYTVALAAGYLSSYSFTLGSCPEARAPWSLISAAWAGHSAMSDPSALLTPWVEDLLDPQEVTLGPVRFRAARYCEASYLVARVDQRSQNQPDGLDLKGASIYLSGTYAAEGGEPVPFTYRTSIGHGAQATFDLRGAGEAATVTATRRLSTLFDGIALAEESEARTLRAVLGNLIDGTVLDAELDAP